MFVIDKTAHYRDAGLGCLGTYKTVRIAFGPIYLSFGWRIRK